MACHRPSGSRPGMRVAGAAAGVDDGAEPVFVLPSPDGAWDRHYVDLQRDATIADMRRAVGAGMRSPEHVKRHTTIGTAADQGKAGNVLALGVLAGLLDVPVGDLGPTTSRPPYVPVSFALYAGRDRGALHDPVRTTPMHAWHVAHGAVFEDVGQWKRPFCFPRPGESEDDAVLRECVAARTDVAAMDASTLGKIDVQGPDAAVLPGPRLHQRHEHRPGRCRPLRRHVLGRRDGLRRRRRAAAGGGPLPHHDDDRERRRGPRLAGGVAADGVARSAGAADLGDRALGDGRGRRPPLARGRRGAGSGDGRERGRLRVPPRAATRSSPVSRRASRG